VAVPADDLAFLDLGEDRLPGVVGELRPDVEALVAEVVEFQDDWIRLTTVGTRMLREVLDE
jgi:hypothetical protein